MGTRAHSSFKTTHSSPPSGIKMAPTIKFRAKNRGGQLVITVVACEDLPDMDAAGIGFGNKSDPYVIVRVGGEEQKTKALSGKLNPEFKKEASTFVFDVDGDVTARRIFFKVMDKDTFTSNDLIGKASIKLTSGQANGVLLSLSLQIKEEEDSDENDD